MKSLAKTLALSVVGFAAVVHAVHAQSSGPAVAEIGDSELAKNVDAFDKQVADDVKEIKHLQAIARKQKDVVKLTCVNDVIVELKPQENLYDTGHEQFRVSTEMSPEAARASYGALSDAAAAIKELRGNAEACVGVTDLYKQESDVKVTHPDFPDDPTSLDPFIPEIEPPAYASPYA